MKKNKIISLKEYEITKDGVLNSKDILEIEKINKLANVDLFEIKANNRIKAKQYVGIVKVNNKNIQILPKIFGDENDKIIKNLLYMLSYTKKLNIKETDIAKLGKVNDLFEVFIYIFSKQLFLLLRKSIKKGYNDVEENSGFLKGKLLFSKHIKHNLFNKSKFFVGYEKMDENILLNRFFKSVCKKLLRITNSNQTYKLLNHILFILSDVDSIEIKNSKILDKIKFTRQNIEYKPVFSLAKLLYFGNSPDFLKHSIDNFSLLFDMNKLFEEFVGEFIRQNKNKIDENISSVDLQAQSKYLFEENKFKLKPDIILNFKNAKKLIIDTKYKKLDTSKNNNGVSQADIYQMFAYGMRYFFKKDENKNIILLYPDYDLKNYSKDYFADKENINIFIRTINLNIDLSSKNGKDDLILDISNILKNSYYK